MQNRINEQVNLFDLVSNDDKNIHTFQEFKEWLINYQLVEPKKIIYSNNHHHEQQQIHHQLKIRTVHTMDENLKVKTQDKNFLNDKSIINSIQNKNLFGQPKRQQSSIKSSISRSSRSLNGYEQINQYEIRQCIGKGAYSQVYLGIDVESQLKNKYAIKVMQSKIFRKRLQHRKKSQRNMNESSQNKKIISIDNFTIVRNEIAILKKINHPYIIKLIQIIYDEDYSKIYLVLQYCSQGYINQKKINNILSSKRKYHKLLQSECKRYYRQLCSAISYIHNQLHISHRDIKPENILLSVNNQVKLSDFGLSTANGQNSSFGGTKLYMPPEVQQSEGKMIDWNAVDIWSLGITLIVLLTATIPPYNKQIINLAGVINSIKDISDQLRDFINKCVIKEPQYRINSLDLLKHAWLSIQGDKTLSLDTPSGQNMFSVIITPVEAQNAITTKDKYRIKNKNLNLL